MNKKLLSLALALVMLVAVFAGCKDSAGESNGTACSTKSTAGGDTEEQESISDILSDTTPLTETQPETITANESESTSMGEEYTETAPKTESNDQSESFAETVTETASKSETQSETETESLVSAEDFVSFCDYRYDTRTQDNFKNNKEYAVYFELPANSAMKSFYIQFTSGSDESSNICLELYKIEQKASESDKLPSTDNATLVYSETVSSVPFKTHSVYLDKVKICEGYYILKITSPDEGSEYNDNIFLGRAWPYDLPEFNIKSYIDGTRSRYAVYGGFIVEHDVPLSQIGELNEEPIDTKIEGEKIAKVIVLSGQSNAAGATPYSHLQRHVSEEKYAEYLNGYSNVKIIYSSAALSNGQVDIKNRSDEFVNTKLGQGYVQSYFGPEVGLAEYLSNTYPDETFYIIKYAVGSASLSGYFNPNDSQKNVCLTALKEKMQLGLDLLENEGYTTKIVAFLWMQGESDANTIYGTYPYYNLQKTMVEQIRSEFSEYAPERGIAFIDAGISNHGTWATSTLMNALKRKYAYESRANYYVDTVSAGLLTLTEDENTDQYHYVSTSVITLGKLFGEKISEHID